MRTDIACAMNGVSLHDLDSRIYVENIKEEPSDQMETANRSGYGVFPLTDTHRDSLLIKITCFVKERDRTAREAVFQKILGWCKQGWFTKNTRPGQRLYVFCTKPPSTEAFDLTARMEIEFTAYGEAYWQEITPLSVSVTTAVNSGTHIIKPNGTQECFLEADIKPVGGALTSVTITVGTQTLALTGLSVAQNSTLKVYYDELHILHITVGSTSLLSKRTPASVDDIVLTAGQNNTVVLSFNTTCTYTIKARGLWK